MIRPAGSLLPLPSGVVSTSDSDMARSSSLTQDSIAGPSHVSSLTTESLHQRRPSIGTHSRSSSLTGREAAGSSRPNTGHGRTASSSSATADTPLPPGAPSGSRINTVTYTGTTIKALIDPNLRVTDVIRQLCANAQLGAQDPPSSFALRDDVDDELIEDGNMGRKITSGRNFKLCPSPAIEAAEMVKKLATRDEKVIKLATYALQRLIREDRFSQEFLQRGGIDELMTIVMSLEGGNTLAYALSSVQNLLESRDDGWEKLDAAFIRKIVNILTAQDRINVCRPAAAILKRLVVCGPENAQDKIGKVVGDAEGSIDGTLLGAMGRAATRETIKTADQVPKTYRYGFEVVYAEIVKEPAFLRTLKLRLASPDTTLCMYSLSLINSLMRNVSPARFDDFIDSLEALDVSSAVVRLMAPSRNEELASTILEYQAGVTRVASHRLRMTVTPTDKRHVAALSYIWLQARIAEQSKEDEQGEAQKYKWRRLGFESENIVKEFSRTGWLGLESCESYVRTDPEHYARLVSEQLLKTEKRQFPWGRAALEVVEILAEHYSIEAGYSATTKYQPLLLSLGRIHYLATRFFLRMWEESGATIADFARVSAVVRSHVKDVLRDEISKMWEQVEADFLESDYRTVRERQMQTLQTDDDYASKASIRNLRSRMYRESYEFVRQQRIQCLREGAWFRNPVSNAAFNSSAGPSRSSKAGLAFGSNGGVIQTRPWRFYRLSPNKKFLYYCEASEKGPIRSGLDDLPERIDLSLIAEVHIQQAAPQTQQTGSIVGSESLTFSLLRAPDQSLADLVALNPSQFSEWTDGLTMLRSDGGIVNTKETADFIQTLTDIGVKIKLLDLTGEQVEIPSSMDPVPLPETTSFFFAEL